MGSGHGETQEEQLGAVTPGTGQARLGEYGGQASAEREEGLSILGRDLATPLMAG